MNRFLALVAFLFVTASCWADGFVMQATAVPAEVRIPGQRALIQFTNGVERLVIETRFTGEGTNFAWVVPLPSPPLIEEATTGLFPTLQCLFQPRLRHEVPHCFQWFIGLVAGGYLLRFVRRGYPRNCLDVLACLFVGLAVIGLDPLPGFCSIVLFLALLYAVDSVRARDSDGPRVTTFFFAVLFFGFVAAVLSTPSTARTKGMSTSSNPAICILDRKMVGIFETTTISSRDPAALQIWLKTNGFATPTNRNEAIAGYVKDGWVFVTAKIRRDDPALQTATPHPLSFTFKAGKAVYPMRLTGIDNGPLQVDLYVFGSDRAEAPHFEVERCAIPVYPAPPPRHEIDFASFKTPETLQIAHPLLRKWVDGTPVATKLTATLNPEDMRDDVWLSWIPFSKRETILSSRQGACIYAANWGAGIFAAIMLAAFAFGAKGENRAKRLVKFLGVATGSGIIIAAVIYCQLPKTEVRFVRSYHTPAIETFKDLEIAQIVASQETNLTEVRARLAEGAWGHPPENFLSGGFIHEEDSPGNYQLRQSSNRVECVIYDASGTPSSD